MPGWRNWLDARDLKSLDRKVVPVRLRPWARGDIIDTMNKKSIVSRFYKLNERLYKSAKDPLKSHGPDHHLRVCLNAIKIAEKVKKEVDFEVLIPAALLHDLSAYYPEETGDKYHEKDYKIALNVLRKEKFPKQKISNVLDVIENHGSDPRYRKSNESIETTILRDADKLEAFGPIGLARIIMVRTQRGDTLNQIVDDFYLKGHLKKKYDSIKFPFVKKIAKPEFEYSMSFLRELKNGLGV